LNNLGHSYQQLGVHDAAQNCFEALLSALNMCVQKLHISDDDVCQTDCFFHGVATLILKDPETASAA
jgi:hypothetical protein